MEYEETFWIPQTQCALFPAALHTDLYSVVLLVREKSDDQFEFPCHSCGIGWLYSILRIFCHSILSVVCIHGNRNYIYRIYWRKTLLADGNFSDHWYDSVPFYLNGISERTAAPTGNFYKGQYFCTHRAETVCDGYADKSVSEYPCV